MSEVVSPEQQSPPPLSTPAARSISSFPFFEYVSKITLLVSVGLFVLDPIPPVTRLAAIVATVVVFLLARLERLWTDHQNTLTNEINNSTNNINDQQQENLGSSKSKDE